MPVQTAVDPAGVLTGCSGILKPLHAQQFAAGSVSKYCAKMWPQEHGSVPAPTEGTRSLAKKGSEQTHKRKAVFEHAACLTSLFDTTAFCHLDAVFFCHVAACSHCSDTKTALEKKGKFRGDAIESALPGLESIVQPGVDVHAAHCGAASGSGAAVQTPSVYGRTGGAEGSEGWKCLSWCDWCGRDYRHRPRCNQAVRR